LRIQTPEQKQTTRCRLNDILRMDAVMTVTFKVG